MNVHEEFCPSGPYLWRYDRFFELLTNVGLSMRNAGTLTPTAYPARLAALEERLRGATRAVHRGTLRGRRASVRHVA